jgi:hypothetical protein
MTGPERYPVFIEVTPQCPEHGPMKARLGQAQGYTCTVWVCPGWDGEGCDYQAPSREWGQLGWVTEQPRFRFRDA